MIIEWKWHSKMSIKVQKQQKLKLTEILYKHSNKKIKWSFTISIIDYLHCYLIYISRKEIYKKKYAQFTNYLWFLWFVLFSRSGFGLILTNCRYSFNPMSHQCLTQVSKVCRVWISTVAHKQIFHIHTKSWIGYFKCQINAFWEIKRSLTINIFSDISLKT